MFLQTHQNKYHKDIIARLSELFSNQEVGYATASKEDRTMWEYLATMYKNSNKGIKGRGKGCRVVRMDQAMATPSPPQTHGLPQQHPINPLPIQIDFGQSEPYPRYPVDTARDYLTTINMIDRDAESAASPTSCSSPGGSIYDEYTGRELAFGDRMYGG